MGHAIAQIRGGIIKIKILIALISPFENFDINKIPNSIPTMLKKVLVYITFPLSITHR
jgi:hypothetical protein